MKAIDMTPIIKKYPGYFVALSYDGLVKSQQLTFVLKL